jgi:hypothetical protein
MLFYAQKMPKKDLFAHASQYCTRLLRIILSSRATNLLCEQAPCQRPEAEATTAWTHHRARAFRSSR